MRHGAPQSSTARTNTPRRVCGLIAAPALAGVLLSGCGPTASPDPQASPSSSEASTVVLSEVTAATSEAGTARVQIRTDTSAGTPGSGASFDSTGTVEGVVDFASGNGQLVTKLPTGGQLEQRTVDGVQYIQLPTAAGRDQNKPWTRIVLPAGVRPGLGHVNNPS